MSNPLLYTKFVVTLLVLLLIVVELFDGALMSAPLTITVMSLVAIIVSIDLM